jgi:lipopolysaccharide/colanic/teichoic acid biosynthesis glycosyltransferase
MYDPRVIRRIVPRRRVMDWITRLGDLALAAALLATTLPLMVIVALAIKLESPGPVLDKLPCIAGGHRFCVFRFRTAEYGPYLSPHLVPPPWAQRPTPIGRFLRCTRIEALPQLINVLRGDISILDPDGSRPPFLD